MKEPAHRNKTLSLNQTEYDYFCQQLIYQKDIVDVDSITDKIICADLFTSIDLLPDCFADLIIIDPPYNLQKNFNGFVFNTLSLAEYENYVRSWFSKVCRKLKPDGTLYMCGDWKCTSTLQKVMSEYLTIRNRITWQREKGRGASNNWKNSMEDIWYGVADEKHFYFDLESVKIRRRVLAPYRENGEPKDWDSTSEGNFRNTCPSNLWDDISVPFWSMPENTEHPTQKPEKLISKLILASSKEGDMVFDPFLGSGTTAVVAKKLKRHYCGIELNKNYCCIAQKRLSIAETNNTIQGYIDGVFLERNTIQKPNKKNIV